MTSHRILHLEDDDSDARLIRRALERAGLNVEIVVATDAAEYEAALGQDGFDLVLSDNCVPGIGSLGALNAARARQPGVPFICVSGFWDDKTVDALIGSGVTCCVLKSRKAEVIAAVRQSIALTEAHHKATGAARHQTASDQLVGAVQQLSHARDFDTIRQIVRQAARALTGADGATLVLREGDQCHYVDEDAISPLWKGKRFPLSCCISGWVMLNHETVTIEDVYADPRIPADAYRPTFVKSLSMVPIRTDDPLGAIGAYWSSPHKSDAREIALMQALANTTAVAMENVRVYAELEQRVLDRTAQLAAANRELETFSFSVSHDLRSPLHAISGYAELLEEACGSQLDANSRGFLERILKQTARMGDLIDDFLRLAQIRTTELQVQSVNLTRLSDSIVDNLRASEPARVVRFTRPENLLAEGDPRLLRVALENLLINAWKYTGKLTGEALIELSQLPSSAPPSVANPGLAGTTPVYFVRDNGAGFDPRYADKLFTPFQRLHSAKDFPGSGVGLATVQRIVLKHGGRIWAESQPGAGATFFFTFAPDAA